MSKSLDGELILDICSALYLMQVQKEQGIWAVPDTQCSKWYDLRFSTAKALAPACLPFFGIEYCMVLVVAYFLLIKLMLGLWLQLKHQAKSLCNFTTLKSVELLQWWIWSESFCSGFKQLPISPDLMYVLDGFIFIFEKEETVKELDAFHIQCKSLKVAAFCIEIGLFTSVILSGCFCLSMTLLLHIQDIGHGR